MTDPTKDNFNQPPKVKEILNKLEISKNGYYRALSISKDEALGLHLKQPNSWCITNYFNVGLKAQVNMDVQLVFNKYKAVTYMCQCFSKTEGQCSQAMKQVAKEAFGNNMYHHDTMKTVAKAYLSNRECSVQETVYHILPELKLRRIFPAVYFVNSLLGERVQVLLSEKELRELPDDNPNIFKYWSLYGKT